MSGSSPYPDANELAQMASQWVDENPPAPFVPAARPTSIVDDKRASVAAASDDKRTAMGGAPIGTPTYSAREGYDNAAIAATGSGRLTQSQLQQDLQFLSPTEVRAKYGTEQGNAFIGQNLEGQGEYNADTSGTRTGSQVAADVTSGVGMGLVNSLGGIAALGAGLVSDSAGSAISGALNDITEFGQSTQSPTLQARRRALETRNRLDTRDNTARYEEDVKKDGSFIAGLSRIGRNIVDSVGNAVSDPTTLSDGVAQGVGSLLAGGPTSKLVGAVGAGARRGAAAVGGRVENTLAAIGRRLPDEFAIGIGAMEAGGAYSQQMNEVGQMSEADLQKNSPLYNRLRAEGQSHEEARQTVAGRTGLLSAALVAPGAIAAGKLVSRFEANPLAAGSVRNAGSNILNETVEEGLQSGIGQLAQNAATGQIADTSRTLSEGVGEQIGQGALFGLGTAGALQAPIVAGRTTQNALAHTGREIMKAVDAAGESLTARADAMRSSTAQASPVATEKLVEATDAMAAEAPAAQATMEEAVQASDQPDDVKEAQLAHVQKLFSLNTWGEQDIQGTNPTVRDVVGGATSRVDAISRLADQINSTEKLTPDDVDYVMELDKQVSAYQQFFAQSGDVWGPIHDNGNAGKIINQYNGLMASITNSTKVKEAFQEIQNFYAEQAAEREKQEEVLSRSVPAVDPAVASAPVEVPPAPPKASSADTRRAEAMRAMVETFVERMADPNITTTDLETDLVSMKAQVGRSGGLPQALIDRLESKVYARAEARKAARNTPRDAQITAGMSQVMPEKVKLEDAEQALFMADQGQVDLTPQQIASLRGSVALLRAARNAENERAELGLPVTKTQQVSNEVQLRALEATGQGHKVSALGHMKKVTEAYRNGNMKEAAQNLGIMNDFVTSLKNKHAAMLEHFEQGGAKRLYEYRKPDGTFGLSPKNWEQGITPEGATSVSYAQNRTLETNALINTYNGLVEAFPELGLEPAQNVKLNQLLVGNPDQVAKDFRDGVRVAPYKAQAKAPAIAKQSPSTATPGAVATQAPQAPAPAPAPKKQEYAVDTRQAAADDRAERAAIQAEARQAEARLKAEDEARQAQAERDDAAEREAIQAEAQEAEARAKAEKAKPAVASEPVKEVLPAPEAPKLIGQDKPAGRFDRLIGKVNYFREAFREPKSPRTRFSEEANPYEAISAVIADPELMAQVMGEKNFSPDQDVRDGFVDQLEDVPKIRALMEQRLQTFFKDKMKGKLDGAGERGWHRTRLGKATNIAEETADGGITYNKELVDKAILAGLQWVLTAKENMQRREGDDVSSIVGFTVNDNSILVEEFNNKGLTSIEAFTNLSQKIKDFWGMDPNRNTPDGYVEGIPEAVAKELLTVMAHKSVGLVVRDKIKLNVKDHGIDRDFDMFNPAPMDKNDPMGKDLHLIEKIMMKESDDQFFFGNDKPRVAETQMRNRAVKLTPTEQRFIRNENSTVYKLNMVQIGLYGALGEAGMVELLGAGDLKDRTLNVNHRMSLEGKNQSIVSSIATLKSLMGEATARAKAMGVSVDQLPIRYRHEISKVARLQQIGRNTPQGSKFMREAVLPTWSTMDLSSNSTAHYDAFLLGIAQAVGIKVHNMSRATMRSSVEKRLAQMKPAIDMLTEYHGNQKLPSDAVQVIKDAFAASGAGPVSAVGLLAITEYARLQATPQKDRGAFSTPLYLEADGVTNGVINAMMLMTSGKFLGTQIKNLEKGGLLMNSAGPKTMNELRSGETNNTDLYQESTDWLASALDDIRRDFANLKDQTQAKQLEHLLKVMDVLIPKQLSYDPNSKSLKLDRGLTKNPLTITLYGSGARGIAGNLIDELTTEIYAKLSLGAEANLSKEPNFGKAMFGSESVDNDAAQVKLNDLIDGLKAMGVNTNRLLDADLETFKFSNNDIEKMTDTMLNLFVTPLRGAITNTVGEAVMDSSKMVIMATQAQSIAVQYAYDAAIKARLADKKENDPNHGRSDYLSKAEQDAALQELGDLLPMISNGKQTFFPAGKTRSEGKQNILAAALDDTMATAGLFYAPGNSGVSGMPMINIGMGDGNMMMNASVMPDPPKDTLKIFDGTNGKLTTIMEDGRAMNQAVWESWQGNPLANIRDSFKKFLTVSENMEIFENPELRKDMSRLLREQGDEKGAVLSSDEIRFRMESLMSRLDTAAAEVEARRRTLKGVNLNVDQMAAAGAPFVHNGGLDLTGDYDTMAAMLNVEYQKHLNDVMEERGLKPVVVAPAPLTKAMGEAAPAPKTGVSVLDLNGVKRLVKDAGLTPVQQKIFDQITRAGGVEDFSFVHGSMEQLAEYAREKNLPFPTTGEINAQGEIKGVTYAGHKVVYLISPSKETLVHELIHAATYTTLQHYYAGDVQNAAVVDSIKKLEQMMKEFRALDFLSIPAGNTNAYDRAVAAISREEARGNKAGALNEFMAWGLANGNNANTLRVTKASKLVQMAKDAFEQVKALIFGKARIARPDQYLLSNLLFHTSVVVRMQPTVKEIASQTALFQSEIYGTDDRLSDIQETFQRKIVDSLESNDPEDRVRRKLAANSSSARANRLGDLALSQGFDMSPQASNAFRSIVAALGTMADIDPNALNTAQALFTHVSNKMTLQDFRKNQDPNDPNDYTQAERKYDLLMGNIGQGTDRLDRSTLLPVFLGMAITNQEFRSVLAKMDLPKNVMQEWNTLDGILENSGNTLMDKLAGYMSGTSKSKNVQEAIDGLTQRIEEVAQDNKNIVEQLASHGDGLLGKVNDVLVNTKERVSDAIRDRASKAEAAATTKLGKGMARSVEFVASMATEKNGANVAEGINMWNNKVEGKEWFRNLMNDFIGRTASNAAVYDMIKMTRSYVQQVRQQFRENVPTIIAGKFKQKLDDATWELLSKALGQTDLPSIVQTLGKQTSLKLLGDKAATKAEITKYEAEVAKLDKGHAALIQKKAKQLAHHMLTGQPGSNLLRNADSIAHLNNEAVNPKRPAVGTDLVQAVDILTTLYAIDGMSQQDRSALSSLVQDENEGMDFALSYMVGQRKEEIRKGSQGMARFNHYKGHMVSTNKTGLSLVVANDRDFAELAEKSYQRVGDLETSEAEPYQEKRGYYFAPISARATFNQGIAQNVQETAYGVDVNTGYTSGTMTGGRITDPAAVERITRSLAREGNRMVGNLMPVFSDNGIVVAYERSIDPSQLSRLQPDRHFAKMVGVWRGRQVEESQAQTYNEMLIDRLHDMYMSAQEKGRTDEYINLFDSREMKKDKVRNDALNLLTEHTVEYARSKFEGGFYVRRDMLDDAFGYRDASVGDMWTGNSRWSETTQARVKNLAMSVFGNEAYRKLTNGEQIIQNAVKDARVVIVVKSVVVPMSNFVSNIYQLVSRGVPLTTIIRDMPRKTAEVHQYTKSQIRKIEAEAELRASPSILDTRRLEREIQAIEDSHKRMSIWPLIKAGEFSSVSDAGISREEILLTEGKLHAYMEKLVDKLPPGMQTAGKYALVTKDTALFQGLQKAVEYGDFLAKSIIYDDLTKRKKLTNEQALGRVTEEFVNYDRLTGRARGYVENIGMLWFYNFKLRSTKIALSMIRNNPVHALLGAVAPTPGSLSVGTPLGDNFFSKMMGDGLGRSIGPGQGLHAFGLNPWVNAVY